MSSYFTLLFLLIAVGKADETRMKGHLMPIGHQGTSLGAIREMKFSPSAQYFYKNFIRQRQPLVIRNAVKHWLAVKNWKNETYLKEMYGDVPFTVHMQKVYDNSISVREDLKLSEFLDKYKKEPLYLSSSFPPTNMINDVTLPSILLCGEITEKIEDFVLLMNNGDADSPLHHDGQENILSIVSGQKKIILFNSSYSENVYADDFDVLPGLSPINVTSVDLEKYPKFADISFYEAALYPGDLVYIPEYWWHYVYSEGTPNIATNIWFGMFDFGEQFKKANIAEDKDVSKATAMFDELVKQQPSHIECKSHTPALDEVLKIVLSDRSAEHLRIPKTPKRPQDFKLPSGYTMPPLGFGTAGLYPQDTLPAILSALDADYRLIDTAQIYGTEPAVAQAIKQSNVPRSNVTIVTKLHPKNHGYESTISSVEESLRNLETDYIDVFLIHVKECSEGYFKCPEGKPDGVWQDSWRAMEHLHEQGKIRSLGVSNFDVADLTELLNITTVPVSVVQNWFDPLHQEVNVRHFCAKHGIHFMGYSTLGTQWTTYGGMDKNPVLTSPTFIDIASHHQFIVAQVILRWAMHLNVTVIPRSRDPRHIVLNYKSLDIVLSDHEIKTITGEYLPASSFEDAGGDSGKLGTSENDDVISDETVGSERKDEL